MAVLGGTLAATGIAAPPQSRSKAADAASQPPGGASVTATLRAGLDQLAAGDAAAAHQTLEALIDSDTLSVTSERLSAHIANGQALHKLRRYESAMIQFEQALAAAPPHTDQTTLRLAVADAAYRCGRTDKALQHSSAVLDGDPPAAVGRVARRLEVAGQLAARRPEEAWQAFEMATPADQADLRDLAGQIGAAALTARQAHVASRAYRWLSEHDEEPAAQRQAELGLAWAAALGAEPPGDAARKLREFASRYPGDLDALRALRAEAALWRQLDDPAMVDAALQRLVELATEQTEPAAQAMAVAAVDELSLAADRETTPAVYAARRRLVVQRAIAATAGEDAAAPAESMRGRYLLAAALVDAAAANDETYWQSCREQILAHASAAQVLSAALVRLNAAEQDAAAERLAAHVLASLDPSFADGLPDAQLAACCDAVCRWASNAGRWTMLALAAETADPSATAPRLTPRSTRLLAEALMQTRRTHSAQSWFDAAVEAGERDFAVLVRRAELAVALDDLETATTKLDDAAQAVADDASSQRTLIDILRAELAIRRAHLEQARDILQRIVRVEHTDPQVRCRAQWLIGETYLLQQRYREAIEAYRLVESFDTAAGNWTAVALVQAGGAYEQMGRPREAATCYGALLQRFADSQHADAARKRLAALGGAMRR